MLEQLVGFFSSFFANPSAWGIGLAIIFGAIWLVGYWPPLFKKPWLWAVMVISAFLTLACVSFIQIPLQVYTGKAIYSAWGSEVMLRWVLLAGIPQILYSGLVQEGAKLVPMAIYWWHESRSIDPKLGLAIGAMAGAGFGIFEAQWVHNTIFASGWSWEAVQTSGLVALTGFWERFFTVAFHTAASALAGYGLAKGWGWQFYLLASFLHAFLNYGVVLLQAGLLTMTGVEVFVTVCALLVSSGALWLRWRKPAKRAKSRVSPA